METNRLRQFRAVVETGNLRKAAELLAISHGGLSKSMKALETEIGVKLFHPSGRGIVVSDQGIKFYERSKPLLDELDRFLGKETVAASASLRLGSHDVFTSYFIGPLLSRFLRELDVEIHELVPGRLEEALSFRKVDVGITYEPVPKKGIEYVKVTGISMGAFALAGQFTGMGLAEIPFIAPVNPLEGAPSGVKGRDAWPDEKIERNIRYHVDLLATGLEIARQGLAAIFIPKFVARLHNESVSKAYALAPLPFSKSVGNVRRDVYLVKRESAGEDRIFRQIAKALRELCADP